MPDLGFGSQGLEFKDQVLGIWVVGVGFKDWGLGFRDRGLRNHRDQGSGFEG